MYNVCMLKLVLCTVFHWLKAASFHCTDLHMWSINVTDREVYLPCGRLPWLGRDPLSSTAKYVYWSRQQCLRLWCCLNHLLLGVPCEHFSEISPLCAFFLTLLVVISSNLCFQLYCCLLTYVCMYVRVWGAICCTLPVKPKRHSVLVWFPLELHRCCGRCYWEIQQVSCGLRQDCLVCSRIADDFTGGCTYVHTYVRMCWMGMYWCAHGLVPL